MFTLLVIVVIIPVAISGLLILNLIRTGGVHLPTIVGGPGQQVSVKVREKNGLRLSVISNENKGE